MNVTIITLFPEMFEGVFDHSMMLKAKKQHILSVDFINPRDFGVGAHRSVDDTPYGGGPGMVLRVEPLVEAIEAARKLHPDTRVIALTPAGQTFTQRESERLSKLESITLVCGRYEGFDERIMSYVDEQISVGDYILTGGEIPAMTIIDSVVRLIPGVLGDERSAQDESFSSDESIEYPHYTRPDEFRGEHVPDVLRSGNHAEIEAWRRDQSETRSNLRRDQRESK